MLTHRVCLVATWLAAYMFELAFSTGLALTQVVIETNGLVIGSPRVHAPQGFGNGVPGDLRLLSLALAGRLSCPLAGIAFFSGLAFALAFDREQEVHHG